MSISFEIRNVFQAFYKVIMYKENDACMHCFFSGGIFSVFLKNNLSFAFFFVGQLW